MTVRTILTMDKPVLRAKAKKISRFDHYLERLVNDMWETMREAPGVGLAAPQIGESIRVLVAEYEEEHVALVNPEILKRSEEIEYGTEGCLSIPGLVGDDVPRHYAVTVKGRDPKGKEIRVKAEGWWARVLQHEIDHLDGILYIDHIPPDKVRKLEPEEIADEAEIHRTDGKKAAVTGGAEPDRRASPAPTPHAKSGKNGNRQSPTPRTGTARASAGASTGRPRNVRGAKPAESAAAVPADESASPVGAGKGERA